MCSTAVPISLSLRLEMARHSGQPMETRGVVAQWDERIGAVDRARHDPGPVFAEERTVAVPALAGEPRAGHRPRHRRRFRHQACDVPRRAGVLVADDEAAPAGEVDRGPARAHDDGEPVARALPRHRGRVRFRGGRPGVEGRHRGRLRTVFAVARHGVDGRRHGPRHPAGAVQDQELPRHGDVRGHQQVPVGPVPRRLPAGGVLQHRADHRRGSRAPRARPGRGAAPQSRSSRGVPVHLGHRAGVRLRFVHRGPRRSVGARRLRAAPRGTGSGARTEPVPRDRRGDVHGTDRAHLGGVPQARPADHLRVRDQLCRSRHHRSRHRVHLRPQPRPGPRDHDGPDRRGDARRRPRQGAGAVRRHGAVAVRHGHVRQPVGGAERRIHPTGGGRRQGPARAHRRPHARSGPGRHRHRAGPGARRGCRVAGDLGRRPGPGDVSHPAAAARGRGTDAAGHAHLRRRRPVAAPSPTPRCSPSSKSMSTPVGSTSSGSSSSRIAGRSSIR